MDWSESICRQQIILFFMETPPLNIEYWSSLYPVYTDYAEEFKEGIDDCNWVDRVKNLWDWKGLNRSIEFDPIEQPLKQLDREDYTNLDPEEAIRLLSNELQDHEIVSSESLVTSAFILHLMASDPDQYSAKFPIYDRRVWNAYVYLWRIRGDGQHLYNQASNSVSQYGKFCHKFKRTCPENKSQDYERALFIFGRFIMKMSPNKTRTPIGDIDEKLEAQEKALSEMYETADFALINTSKDL